MENVPRVAKIIEAELKEGGALEEFNHLRCVTHIIDMRTMACLNVGGGALPVTSTSPCWSRTKPTPNPASWAT